jgi:hypothetical protein
MDTHICDRNECGEILIFRTVNKEGPNKGRLFCKCLCGKFYWNDSRSYNEDKFKSGSCFRCGNYGCEITDCERVFDWFGNKIPNNDDC